MDAIEKLSRVDAFPPLIRIQDAIGTHFVLDTTTVLSWTLPDGTTLEDYIAYSAGSSLTVEEEDGSPSYADTTTLIVNQDEGLTLSQPGTGQVMVSNACLVRVSATDTTPDYLANKITYQSGNYYIGINHNLIGANEYLSIEWQGHNYVRRAACWGTH